MNRVKRFFARLEEKMVFRACVFAALLMLIVGTMFLLNAHTPLQMDDYDYAFSMSTANRFQAWLTCWLRRRHITVCGAGAALCIR